MDTFSFSVMRFLSLAENIAILQAQKKGFFSKIRNHSLQKDYGGAENFASI
jgi:hypothetical protein